MRVSQGQHGATSLPGDTQVACARVVEQRELGGDLGRGVVSERLALKRHRLALMWVAVEAWPGRQGWLAVRAALGTPPLWGVQQGPSWLPTNLPISCYPGLPFSLNVHFILHTTWAVCIHKHTLCRYAGLAGLGRSRRRRAMRKQCMRAMPHGKACESGNRHIAIRACLGCGS